MEGDLSTIRAELAALDRLVETQIADMKDRQRVVEDWRLAFDGKLANYLLASAYEPRHADLDRRMQTIERSQSTLDSSAKLAERLDQRVSGIESRLAYWVGAFAVMTVIVPAFLSWALSGFKGLH